MGTKPNTVDEVASLRIRVINLETQLKTANEDNEAYRSEMAKIASDLDCINPHWPELRGIDGWGESLSKCVPILVESWKNAKADLNRAIEQRNRIGIEIRGELLPKLKALNKITEKALCGLLVAHSYDREFVLKQYGILRAEYDQLINGNDTNTTQDTAET
jgi:hypothetical protein